MATARTVLKRATRALTRRAPKRQVARACYLAGGILAFAGTTGSAYFYLVLLHLVAPYLPSVVEPLMGVVAILLVALAGLGGFTVIGGGYLIQKGKRLPGLFLVSLGASSTLLGFLLQVALVGLQGGSPVAAAMGALSGMTAIALVLIFWVQLKG